MSDQFDQAEFEKMVAEDDGVPAVASEQPKAAAPAKTPKPKKVKVPEGPNPYGIYVKRTKEVVTMTYLRKWAQCACRGDMYLFNRDSNINTFMTPEYLEQFKGKSVGEYCQAVRTSELWRDPANPDAFSVKVREPKAPKPAKTPKGKKAQTDTTVAAAAADEQTLLDQAVGKS